MDPSSVITQVSAPNAEPASNNENSHLVSGTAATPANAASNAQLPPDKKGKIEGPPKIQRQFSLSCLK
jgi:hypothetical protein